MQTNHNFHDDKVAIVMSTYNGAKYVVEQLNAVMQQTHANWHCYIRDDGSKDDTVATIKAHVNDDNRFSVITDEQGNLGYNKSYYALIALANEQYIAMCDQDDVWQVNRIRYSSDIFEKNPECGYIFSDAWIMDKNSQPLPSTLWSEVGFTLNKQREFRDHELQPKFLSQNACVTGATLVFRAVHRNLFLPLPVLDRAIHDGWISILLSLHGYFGIAEPAQLISYRIHAQQQSGIRHKSLYRKLKGRLSGHRSSIENHLNELLTIRTWILASSSATALKRFEHTFGIILASLEFRSMILMIPERPARISMVFHHLLKGGYKGNPSPFLSALKDLIF